MKISKPIKELLEVFRFNAKKLPIKLTRKIESCKEAANSDFEYTLTTSDFNYVNENIELISINDIVGTTSKTRNVPLLEFISELYNDKYEYGKRSLKYLNNSVVDNIQNINNIEVNKPIRIIKIKDKYYVNRDGNHKTFYLLFMYLIEKELYKDSPKLLSELENRYQIKMLVSKTSSYDFINKICYCLIKSKNRDIVMEFTPNKEIIGILKIKDDKFEIENEEQFITHFYTYFNSLDRNSDKFILLTYLLLKIDYFNNDLVNKIHNLDNDNLVLESLKRR